MKILTHKESERYKMHSEIRSLTIGLIILFIIPFVLELPQLSTLNNFLNKELGNIKNINIK